ncbi:MAG: hypothetical protein HC934_11430 [Acaryochloridaceae cyanobacterium SU_2_1]|nr:hypothetical protein [Acaryochloridaceae cyanobacterium SU_2_1]NJM95638.1 hypothetical protein [Acaryochloridaceae cyanobacterium CSU_5_19]
MNYLIAVLPDRIQAEAAYTALEKAGLPLSQLSILGRGYKTADEFGLIDPREPAQQQARRLLFLSVPVGIFCGATFTGITGVMLFPGAGFLGNILLASCLGAALGTMGGLFSGGTVGFLLGGGDARVYRNRLNAGKYLVIVKGSEALTSRATTILRQYQPENIQGYVEPLD